MSTGDESMLSMPLDVKVDNEPDLSKVDDGIIESSAELEIKNDTMSMKMDESISESNTKRNENGTLVDEDRIQICNIPNFLGHKAFKKFMDKTCKEFPVHKIRQMRDTAYVSFKTSEDAQKAIEAINGTIMKKNTLTARLAPSEMKRKGGAPNQDFRDGKDAAPLKISCKESVTPLADLTYEEQLKIKTKESLKIAHSLINQAVKANVFGAKKWKATNLLREIRPSPIITGYRNKCEFTVGVNLKGEVCVGFVGGRFSKNQHYILPVDDCTNMSSHTQRLVKDFENYVKESGLAPFDEFARVGVWKMLTVREFGADTMLIVTIFPVEEEIKQKIKKSLIERYLDMNTLTTRKFRVTSLYISIMEHASDQLNYELIGGSPYIYETVLDCRFRVSPSAFFQTNSRAAAVLYTTIGEQCGFLDCSNIATPTSSNNLGNIDVASGSTNSVENADGPSDAKRLRLDEEENVEMEETIEKKKESDPGVVLLDICCGTGAIGQCLIKEFRKKHKVCCIGIEMIESAVEDAKQNARDNGIYDNRCQYIAGKAEDVFRSMKYHVAEGFNLEESKVIGVLDPPRAGTHEKVIVGCRMMSSMNRLIFVSCDPNAAAKNIVDLCRPRSNKFEGAPFEIESIIPVDMFPQTKHVEWVVTFKR